MAAQHSTEAAALVHVLYRDPKTGELHCETPQSLEAGEALAIEKAGVLMVNSHVTLDFDWCSERALQIGKQPTLRAILCRLGWHNWTERSRTEVEPNHFVIREQCRRCARFQTRESDPWDQMTGI